MSQDVLVHLVESLPITLDPAVCSDSPSTTAIQNIYETLVTYEGSDVRHMVPLLAESWIVSPDGRCFTFRLRSGVRFHNGHAFDAECVAYSLRRAIRMNQAPAWILRQCLNEDGLQAVDDLTVEMILARPFPKFLHCLAHGVTSIVDPATVAAHGGVTPNQASAWMAEHAVGTGPFRLDEWQAESELVLLRNDQYWREPARLSVSSGATASFKASIFEINGTSNWTRSPSGIGRIRRWYALKDVSNSLSTLSLPLSAPVMPVYSRPGDLGTTHFRLRSIPPTL